MILARLLGVAFLGLAALGQQPRAFPPAQREFQISGVLVDSVTMQPLARAKVAIAPVSQRDDFSTITTAEDGRFHFAHLTKGKYTLSAQRRGYVARAFNEHQGYSSSVAVGPEIDSGNIVFRLPPECLISGTIVDEAGEAVRAAQVLLYRTAVAGGMEGTRRHAQTITDDQGFYHFGHLAAGRYIVAVSARVWYAQRPKPRTQPARVTFTGESPNSFSSTSGGIAAADSAEDESNGMLDVVYPITFFPGTTEPASATPITLKDGEKFVADMNLQPVRSLRLQLSGPEMNAGGNRYVTLERKLFDGATVPVFAETRVSASGAMEVVGVPPGHYTVRLMEPGNGQSARAHEISAVNSGSIAPVEIQGARLSASLQFDPGTPRPAQGFLQIFNMKTRAYFNARITDNNELEYGESIPPGSYEVAVTNGRGTFIKSLAATGARVAGRTIEIKTTGRVKLNVRFSAGMGEVSGTVLRDGSPFAGAMVVLVPADPGDNGILFRRDQSDSDGTFTLQGAIPGKYTVIALENWELEWLNPGVLKPYLAQGAPVEVLPSGKHQVKINVQ